MGIKFISGTDNFGYPLGTKIEAPSSDDFCIANCMIGNNQLAFTRLPVAVQVTDQEPTPILGLGLRKAFMSAAKEWGSSKNYSIKLRSEINTLTELEKSMLENKTEATVLGLAGMALAGPIGVFAAFGARKKGEVVFAMELRSNCSDPFLNDKVIVLSASDKEFQTIKRISNAPSKSVRDFTSGQQLDQENPKDSVSTEIEKLAKLKESGTISEEEFAAAKAKLLGL